MRNLKKSLKKESIIRFILTIIGILSFSFSSQFAWGFIVGGIISKENIHLKTKEGWLILSLITGVMVIALYFLLSTTAVLGFLLSTISYFIFDILLNHYQNK